MEEEGSGLAGGCRQHPASEHHLTTILPNDRLPLPWNPSTPQERGRQNLWALEMSPQPSLSSSVAIRQSPLLATPQDILLFSVGPGGSPGIPGRKVRSASSPLSGLTRTVLRERKARRQIPSSGANKPIKSPWDLRKSLALSEPRGPSITHKVTSVSSCLPIGGQRIRGGGSEHSKSSHC